MIGTNNGAPYIVASALSQVSPNLVWLAASDGRIWRIDWTTGSGIEDCLRTEAGVIHDMTLGAVTIDKQLTDIVLVSESVKNAFKIVAYEPSNFSNPKSQTLQSQSGRVSILRAANGGGVLVGAAGDTLIVGALKAKSIHGVEDLVYDFYSANTTDGICCLSTRYTPKKPSSKKKALQENSESVIDVAVGSVRGGIYIYSDILTQLRGKSRKGLDVPKKQHWHQRAVHSIAWSSDGELSTLPYFHQHC